MKRPASPTTRRSTGASSRRKVEGEKKYEKVKRIASNSKAQAMANASQATSQRPDVHAIVAAPTYQHLYHIWKGVEDEIP
jgi:hypothetical protein